MRLEPGPGRTKRQGGGLSWGWCPPGWQLGMIAMQLLQKTPVSSLSWGTIRDPGLSPLIRGMRIALSALPRRQSRVPILQGPFRKLSNYLATLNRLVVKSRPWDRISAPRN